MVTLDPKDGYYVLINTFTVDPDRAEELMEVLSEATVNEMSKQPGFVSANLHISADRKYISNYSQWRTKAHNEAMMKDPKAREHMVKAAEIATSFEPLYYELRESHETAAA